MRRLVLAALVVTLLAGVSLSQTTQPTECKLTREQAPAVRGVRLGMSADDLLASVPGISDDDRNNIAHANGFPNYGAIALSVYPRAPASQRFDGIDYYYIRLFDGQLVQYSVYYRGSNSIPRGPYWPDMDVLVAKFADAYHLPGTKDWVNDGPRRLLRCQGFEARVDSVSGAAIITVSTPGNPWVAEAKKRAAEGEEQLRRNFKP
ncbi:MAG TPA: hypothetical protein VKD91_13505 [Pyrinomonadaceae bacterium]|nr:hypothetical protein [Pyrinomonadaceae bacterium]